jgi:hypothetical protein
MQSERRPNPDRSAEALEARLRGLPPPPIPAGLEARLLAVIPAARRTSPRLAVRVLLVGALAAACLLVVLAWQSRGRRVPDPSPAKQHSAQRVIPRPLDNDASIAAWQSRQVLDDPKMPPFAWPLEETWPIRAATSIPPDLLN